MSKHCMEEKGVSVSMQAHWQCKRNNTIGVGLHSSNNAMHVSVVPSSVQHSLGNSFRTPAQIPDSSAKATTNCYTRSVNERNEQVHVGSNPVVHRVVQLHVRHLLSMRLCATCMAELLPLVSCCDLLVVCTCTWLFSWEWEWEWE
jgi:hypothetical protein